jgi:drug/metabolite transporter (DMT)-like permease
VASFAFSTVLFSALLDTWIFEENMPIHAWAGMAVIVLAGIWAAQLSLREKK